jgi:hypothetical protein
MRDAAAAGAGGEGPAVGPGAAEYGLVLLVNFTRLRAAPLEGAGAAAGRMEKAEGGRIRDMGPPSGRLSS